MFQRNLMVFVGCFFFRIVRFSKVMSEVLENISLREIFTGAVISSDWFLNYLKGSKRLLEIM